MENKRRFAFNRNFNLYVVFLFVLGELCVSMAAEDILGGVIGFALLALFIFAVVMLTPCGYLFDRDGVTVCYLVLPNERYLWERIRSVEIKEDSGSTTSIILDLFFSKYFQLHGNLEGKQRFYMRGEIRKSRRTKRLLEEYWDGIISDPLKEDDEERKSRRLACKAKKEFAIRKHLADEVVAAEREARKQVRGILAPFAEQATHAGFELRTEFLYITKNFEELPTRPDEGYTYTVLVEISHPGETDENRIVTVSTDLLHVRLGRTAYRGVPNGKAFEELQGYLSKALTEIILNGIEVYCKNDAEND